MGELVLNNDDIIYGTNDEGFPYSKSVFARIEAILNSQIETKEENSIIKFSKIDDKMIEKMIDKKLKTRVRVEGSTLIIGE